MEEQLVVIEPTGEAYAINVTQVQMPFLCKIPILIVNIEYKGQKGQLKC